MPKVSKEHQKDCIEWLRKQLPLGSRVYCVLRSVSKSGMSRRIDFYAINDNRPLYLTGRVAAALGYTYTPDCRLSKQGLRVDGCGMDMGFSIVYELGRKLYPDHENPDALVREWM